MEVWVTGQPHLLYETVELLFAYVNRIPAVELTQEMWPVPVFPRMTQRYSMISESMSSPRTRSALPVLPATWSITPWSPPAETWPQTVRACVRPGKGNEEIGNAWWT